jgi:hypothetical protein
MVRFIVSRPLFATTEKFQIAPLHFRVCPMSLQPASCKAWGVEIDEDVLTWLLFSLCRLWLRPACQCPKRDRNVLYAFWTPWALWPYRANAEAS